METGTRHGAEPEAGWSPHTQSKLHSEHALLQQATVWLQQVLGSQMPAGKPASELFRDCSILGRVADVVQAARQGRVPAHRPPPPPGASRRRADAINDFVRWQALCTELGVGRDQLPLLADVEQGRGVPAICRCLWAAADKCGALGLAVPAFGADARSSLRRSMTRDASAKRAELFSGSGPSPPKRPSLPLLTPRAFQGRAGTPGGGCTSAALRDSNSGLPAWRQGGQKAGTPQQQAQQPGLAAEAGHQGNDSSLGRRLAAMERAAAQAARLRTSPDAVASRSSPPQPQQQVQQRRRPVLPTLDLQAAAAAAAEEAAEEEEEEAAFAAAQAASPLSSPASSPAASPGAAYYSSSSYFSSSVATSSPDPSPSRYRLTPNTLKTAAQGNPLWSTSPPRSLTPIPMPAFEEEEAQEEENLRQPEAVSPPLQPVAAPPALAAALEPQHGPRRSEPAAAEGPPQPEMLQPRRSAVEREEEEGEVAYSRCGGDLLESLLSPPHLKPAHSQLLGALMHTSGGGAAAAAAAAEQRRRMEEQRAAEEQEQERLAAAAALAAAPAVSQVEEAEVDPSAAEAPAPDTEPLPASQPVCTAASAATQSEVSSRAAGGGGGVRKLALVLLGAVAGAAAAVAAGASHQQQQRGRRSGSRPQRVPTLGGMRAAPAGQQPVPRRDGRARSSGAVVVAWDSPDVLTQG